MSNLNDQVWKEILIFIEREIGNSYNFWFNNVDYEIKGDEISLKFPNQFMKDHVKTRYGAVIDNAVKEVTLQNYKIDYGLSEELIRKPVDVDNGSDTNLIKRYTFENFVVGKSNEFPHAAAISVAESPGSFYNPLFIYGSSGLGKTHLMHAIGNYLLDKNPKIRPMYVSSEQFTNELVEALRRDTTPEFRDKYRNVDILLVDDIQFLIGKEGIQEEFFHTFNVLYQNQKQIVVTSDKPPKDLKGLENRIITRLGGGLIADIMSPDIETRTAILRNKNEQEGFEISDAVIDYIAENIDSNIRELEGALLRIVAYSNLTSREVDLEMAQNVLKDILKEQQKVVVDAPRIKEKVSEVYGISIKDMESRKRPKDIAYARQVAMYLCRMMTEMSLPKIGAEFGGRDHTTVIHAVDKITKEVKTDPETKKTISDLQKMIKSN